MATAIYVSTFIINCETDIQVCNGAVTAFGARIIQSFGYTSLQTIALTIPGGASTCVTIYLFTYLSQRFKNSRTYVS